MNVTTAFRFSAGMGFLAVALGAFGAHGLKNILIENGSLAAWQTAALYHLVHSVVLLLLSSREPFVLWAWRFLFAGIVFFSGSLYAHALTGFHALVFITPIGGFFLLAGWLFLVLARKR